MLNLILSIIPCIIALFYFIYMILKKNKIKNIQTELLSGLNCYECKCKIELSEFEMLNNIENLYNHNEKLTLCKSCNRDLKIDILKSKKRIFNKIKLFIISKNKFDKITLILFTIIVPLVILNIFATIKGVHIFGYLLNSFLTFYWIIIIYRDKFIYIKKNRSKNGFFEV